MEPQEGEEVSSHGDQSGLWYGEGLLSVGELGQRLALGEVGRVNVVLEWVKEKGLGKDEEQEELAACVSLAVLAGWVER